MSVHTLVLGNGITLSVHWYHWWLLRNDNHIFSLPFHNLQPTYKPYVIALHNANGSIRRHLHVFKFQLYLCNDNYILSLPFPNLQPTYEPYVIALHNTNVSVWHHLHVFRFQLYLWYDNYILSLPFPHHQPICKTKVTAVWTKLNSKESRSKWLYLKWNLIFKRNI